MSDTNGSISLAESSEVSDLSSLRSYFKKSVDSGLEGIIVKNTKGGYKPGVRNYEWIKIKRSIEKELVDTIDMVIVGYFSGSGRRFNLGLGAILCGILNKENETIDVICKVGTGIGDELLKEMKDKLERLKVDSIPINVRCPQMLRPDIWVAPKYVVTVDADEITRNISRSREESDIGNGLSLRFPRLVEFDRDKLVEDISTVEELQKMYEMRKSV
jgi:DNA ligase-1